jgi:uncharacterized membrane protein YccC
MPLPDLAALARGLRPALPALLFGLRVWAAVCLALYVAFWLELDKAQWAGTSAAIACQPTLGASLQKGSFRVLGTAVGAVAIVLLTACFPQHRISFLLGLALWGALCGFVATTLRNFTAYGASLAGYTAVIVASDLLGATGGTSSEVLLLAIDRASAICIGVVCAGIVVAATTTGDARRRLAGQLAGLAAEITGRLAASLVLPAAAQGATREIRRGLIGRVVALGPVVDEALGEAPDLRYRARRLQAAADGLLAALSGWRTVATCREREADAPGRAEAAQVLACLPAALREAPTGGEASGWLGEPARLRHDCRAAVRRLMTLPAGTPTLRLMADATAAALLAISNALDGLALLVDPGEAGPRRRAARRPVPDLLPAWINAARIFATIAACALFWVITAWPSGALAMTFAAVGVILLSPLEDRAYAGALMFLVGTAVATLLAAIVDFALLPGVESFAGFALALGLVLVPAGAAASRPWRQPMFVALTANFIPLLGPANQMTYDTAQFYNTGLAILAGIAAAALAMVLLPPLPPGRRVARLLAATLADLRRLAAGRLAIEAADWEGRVYGRLLVLPATAEPLQLARLVAALSLGTEIIHLRRLAPRLGLAREVEAALAALAAGDGEAARRGLVALDDRLAHAGGPEAGAAVALRARGWLRGMAATLAQHAAYLEAPA